MPDLRIPLLVWGGGTGGVAAALQAARAGARTLLLTPGGWLGGMLSAAGVCAPDGNELSPWQTGLWGVLLRELARLEPGGLDHNWVSCFGFRPASAEALLRRWVAAEPLLQWWPGCRLRGLELEALAMGGERIRMLEIERGGERTRLRPTLVIDGSDRGDLLAHGLPHRLGWEPREQWQEPSAPPQRELERDPFFQRQPVQSPTWVVMGQLGDAATAEAAAQPMAPAEAQPPAPPRLAPPFERACERFGLERTLTYGRLPGGLVMLNWPLHGNDWHQDLGRAFSADPASGDLAAEAELYGAMQAHSLAFAEALQQASGGWLQAGACFPDAASHQQAIAGGQPAPLSGSSPLALMPYWREGRRLVALRTLVEGDLLPQGPGASRAPLPLQDGQCEAIAVGNYANDHHYPGPDWPLAAKSCRWGGRWSGTPFCVPYRALVSERCCNLLAADKAIGTSHMANGATRLQPLVVNVGQAAGLAAALCLELDLAPAALPVARLQRALVSDPRAPAAPLPLWDTPWHHPQWCERQERALRNPELLGADGQLAGSQPADPQQAPAEPGEQLFRGVLASAGDGQYRLESDAGSWPLITLEPGLHHWLQQQELPRSARLIGCLNPWGPWIRASRLAD